MIYQNWHQAGVNKLSSLVEGNKNPLLTFKEFLQKRSIKCNWLQYFGLTSAILSEWKNYLKEENQASTINLPAIDTTTCKTIHRLRIGNQDFFSSSGRKKANGIWVQQGRTSKDLFSTFARNKGNQTFNVSVQNYSKHTIYECYLSKMKKVQEPFCPYCTNVEQTVNHLFVSRPVSFWSEFTRRYQSLSNETII